MELPQEVELVKEFSLPQSESARCPAQCFAYRLQANPLASLSKATPKVGGWQRCCSDKQRRQLKHASKMLQYQRVAACDSAASPSSGGFLHILNDVCDVYAPKKGVGLPSKGVVALGLGGCCPHANSARCVVVQ